MTVPDFQSLMLPTLQALADGSDVSVTALRARVATAEGLTEDDTREMLPSGRQTMFSNRVAWALSHMLRAGLVERATRAVYRLTPDGKSLLSQGPARVDIRSLREIPRYAEWGKNTRGRGADSDAAKPRDNLSETPLEALQRAAQQLREELEADVLDRVRKAPFSFLESVVIDLLRAMKYGGGDPDMGRVTGGSGDGGIDGTIREDALGLDEVYVQAKRYADGSSVGEGDLRNFVGAIDAAGTVKGVFVTTARFSGPAREFVARSPKRIALIDGEELARLMVDHDVGVRTRDVHRIKRIDEDYFEPDGA